MSDLALTYENGCFDFRISDDDLVLDQGLETAVAISLFSDARVTIEELEGVDESRRGWWGDMFPEIDQDKIGSKLWLLDRSKMTLTNRTKAEEFVRDALAWMIDDGVTDQIDVVGTLDQSTKKIEVAIDIFRPFGTEGVFSAVWDGQSVKGNS